MALTFQSGLKSSAVSNTNLEKYSLFLGGLNVTRDALAQYDPLRTGFGRIFMIRGPRFLADDPNFPEYNALYNKYKHIIEYGNTGVSGNGNITMNFNTMQGGYTNREMEIPNIASDDSKDLTIKVYEFSGSPVREFTQLWINGVSDIQSGFAHYYGSSLPRQQSNHTAEFIYVVTDPSGINVEYAALFANCFPKEVRLDQFNYDSGNHDLVQLDLTFSATRYMSPQINYTAARLISKYNVMMNSLYFNGGANTSESLKVAENGNYYTQGTLYNPYNGELQKINHHSGNTGVFEAAPTYNDQGFVSSYDMINYRTGISDKANYNPSTGQFDSKTND